MYISDSSFKNGEDRHKDLAPRCVSVTVHIIRFPICFVRFFSFWQEKSLIEAYYMKCQGEKTLWGMRTKV